MTSRSDRPERSRCLEYVTTVQFQHQRIGVRAPTVQRIVDALVALGQVG